MSDTFPFSFEHNSPSGACVIAMRERLHSRCLSVGEVDANIKRLKDCLDQVAVQMKQSIKEQEGKPIGVGSD